MEAAGRPEFGVCAAVDVHYLSTGGTRRQPCWPPIPPSRTRWPMRRAGTPGTALPPGEFYRRELPPLRALMDELSGLSRLPDALRRADTLARAGPLAVSMTDHQPD